MHLTRGADYGARGVICLARRPVNTILLISEIARAEDLPESYLAKIFQDLARNGIVRSHRGARGGFSLARSADDITLLEVIEAIEGPISLNDCLTPNAPDCDRIATCPLYPTLKQAQDGLLEILEQTTLGILARRVLPSG